MAESLPMSQPLHVSGPPHNHHQQSYLSLQGFADSGHGLANGVPHDNMNGVQTISAATSTINVNASQVPPNTLPPPSQLITNPPSVPSQTSQHDAQYAAFQDMPPAVIEAPNTSATTVTEEAAPVDPTFKRPPPYKRKTSLRVEIPIKKDANQPPAPEPKNVPEVAAGSPSKRTSPTLPPPKPSRTSPIKSKQATGAQPSENVTLAPLSAFPSPYVPELPSPSAIYPELFQPKVDASMFSFSPLTTENPNVEWPRPGNGTGSGTHTRGNSLNINVNGPSGLKNEVKVWTDKMESHDNGESTEVKENEVTTGRNEGIEDEAVRNTRKRDLEVDGPMSLNPTPKKVKV